MVLSCYTTWLVNLEDMSTPRMDQPAAWLITTSRAAAGGFVVLAVGLTVQLWRHDALLGGRVARDAFSSHEATSYRVPHFVANGVSLAGGTVVAPALLLVLAGVLAVRARQWKPLLVSICAVVLLDVCLAVGKLTLGQSAVSGPATTTIVCWGVATWLLVARRSACGIEHQQRSGPSVRTALHWLAGSAALVIGVAQLYLGHPLIALLASWALGAALLGILAPFRPRASTQST